jgi:nucleotide-binding universal stress UspA family protein
MITINRLLVAMDFTEGAFAALEQGRQLADAFGATLHVLSIVTEPLEEPWGGYIPAGAFFDTVERFEAARHARLAALFSAADVATGRIVLATHWGEASDRIVEYAVAHQIDLIVCGTHGRTGFSRIATASVAERIVRRAGCPVLTVHADHASMPAA